MTIAADHTTLESFFYSSFEAACRRSGRELPHDLGAYVVGLLSRFARKTGSAGRRSAPLSIQYLSARHSRGGSRAGALREVGDRALYISGAVPESLKRSAVNLGYVRSIGESAYAEVAETTGGWEVFEQLAARFVEVSDVIADVLVPDDEGSNLLAVYERWQQRGDEKDLRRLMRAGVVVHGKGTDTLQ